MGLGGSVSHEREGLAGLPSRVGSLLSIGLNECVEQSGL